MYHVRTFITRNTLKMLYYTLVYPYLSYCNIIWGSACKTLLDKLVGLQKRALRMCTGASFRSSSNPLFLQLQILKISDIYKIQVATFMYKVKLGLLPSSSYNTRKSSFFVLNNFRTTIREHAINIYGPRLWNSLPDNIQNCHSFSLFRKLLTAHFITSYHDC